MTLIDPETERVRRRQEPPFMPVWLAPFEASHLLAFGTHWRLSDYVDELTARLANNETLPFVFDEPHYNALVRRYLVESNHHDAVAHYMSSRGLTAQLQPAALLLAEAARRAQVVTRARRAGATEREILPAPEWSDREYFRFERTGLFRRDQQRLIETEWFDLQFFSADVERLRAEGLAPAQRPDLPLATVSLLHPIAAQPATWHPFTGEKLGSWVCRKEAVEEARRRLSDPGEIKQTLHGVLSVMAKEAGKNWAPNSIRNAVREAESRGAYT